MKLAIVTGPSGSGKTTLSNRLLENLNNVCILSTDNYYKTGFLSKLISTFIRDYFDKSISFDKNLIKKDLINILENQEISHFYKYDFIKKKRFKFFKDINKIDYLIIEGIFAYEIIRYIKNYDYIFIKMKISKKICRERACRRDCNIRGKKLNQSYKEFNSAWNIYIKKEKHLENIKFKNIFLFRKSSDIKKVIKILSTNIS